MNCLNIFRPNEILRSVYQIDLQALWNRGYKSILFDLDNTLLPWNDENVTQELENWFARLKEIGFSAALISNNHAPRILPVAQKLEVVFLPDAHKPVASAANLCMAMIDAQKDSCVMVGDQMITDVWMGNKAGLYTILVSPISSVEYGGTRINRVLERILMRAMGLKRPEG